VLVTSQNGEALAVIRNLLPEPVRRLCVQMNSDRTDKDLERSIVAVKPTAGVSRGIESLVASGCGSPVRTATASATSARSART
jgi:hypothetical protein